MTNLSLGFVRGTAPSKWAERYPGQVELMPIDALDAPANPEAFDAVLERVAPGEVPPESAESRTRHAVRLYEEDVALVVSTGEEELGVLDRETLSLMRLLDYPGLPAQWPEPEPWADIQWKPDTVMKALDLVKTGIGGVLMPFPLARHLADKREHKILPLGVELPGTSVWVSWAVDRDDEDIQTLVGVMRGRTPRSSRNAEAIPSKTVGKTAKKPRAAKRTTTRRRKGGRR